MLRIENKTCLLPHIICENAIWEFFELDPLYRQIDAMQCNEIVELLTPSFVERANTLYNTNKHFRKGITDNEKGRDKLAMWFIHWANKGVKDYFKTHEKIIELPF